MSLNPLSKNGYWNWDGFFSHFAFSLIVMAIWVSCVDIFTRRSHHICLLEVKLSRLQSSSFWRLWGSSQRWGLANIAHFCLQLRVLLVSCTTTSRCRMLVTVLVGRLAGWRSRTRFRMNVTPLCVRVCHDGLVHASFHLCLPIAMVKLLSDPLIDFNEFDQFLVQLLNTKQV